MRQIISWPIPRHSERSLRSEESQRSSHTDHCCALQHDGLPGARQFLLENSPFFQALLQIVWTVVCLSGRSCESFGARNDWKSHAIDSLMPEKTPASLGLLQQAGPGPSGSGPRSEGRGRVHEPPLHCQPQFAKFSVRPKPPKALWDRHFNTSTIKKSSTRFGEDPFLFCPVSEDQ